MSVISIIIKDMKGNTRDLKVSDSDTIFEGKKKISEEKNMWKFDGKVLSDQNTFKFYEIEDGDTIVSAPKVIGGLT